MPSALQQALALVRGWTDANELLCVGFAQAGDLVKGDRAAFDRVSAVALARYCELVGNKRALTSREAMQLMGGRPGLPGQEPKVSAAGKNLTHFGLAERVVMSQQGNLKFQIDHEKFLRWTGARWEAIRVAQAKAMAREAIIGLYDEAAGIRDGEMQSKFLERIKLLESDGFLKGVVGALEATPELHVGWKELNKSTRFISAANGAIDLDSDDGEIVHDRELLLTMQNDVAYKPEASCDRFIKALSDTFEGRHEDILWYELAVGYTFSGSLTERAMFFHKGKGTNGKSMLMNAICSAVGEYAVVTDFRVIATEPGAIVGGDANGASPALRRLMGSRLAYIDELPKGGVLRDAAVKLLAGGGGRVQARGLREDIVEFDITFAFHVNCNELVAIRGGQESTWKRVCPVVYTRQFNEDENPNLPAELFAEREGILAWLVRCVRKYKQIRAAGQKLRDFMPSNSRKELQQLKKDQDPLEEWLDEVCVFDEAGQVSSDNLWASYGLWLMKTGGSKTIANRRALVNRLREYTSIEYTENVKQAGTDRRCRGFKGLRMRKPSEGGEGAPSESLLSLTRKSETAPWGGFSLV